jgi:hypothetical protein
MSPTSAVSCRSPSRPTRWRSQFGGLKADDAKRLKDLERENSTLKRLLADAELEKAALKEIARGNFYARNADATRAAVHHVIVTMKVSERFACRVTGQNRTTQRRLRCRLRSPVSVDDAGLLGLADGCAPFRTA